jgi:AcrR family transcriptional regulator
VALMPEDDIFRTTLPPGRHRLPRDFVARHQRDRLFAAIVILVDKQGYPATSLTQIVKTAGIARHTFYDHFEDKEGLFLALFDRTSENAIRVTREAAEAENGPWEDKVRAGIAAMLAGIAQDQRLARVCLTEALSASLTTLAHYEAATRGFAQLLRTGREVAPAGADLPQSLEDIIVGGVTWMLTKRLSKDPGSVEGLLPGIVEFLVTPYLGQPAARRAAEASG